jgi:hypothetical protein
LGAQDATLGSQAPRTEELPDEWTPPTNAFLETNSRTFVAYGVFEYCDIFGQYHCDSFQYKYAQDKHRMIDIPVLDVAEGPGPPVMCSNRPLTNPTPQPDVIMIMGKKYQWKEMPPCEQPTEKEYSEQ